jgi:hypothetical protein
MTEKKKILFATGCSHAAGSEIDGNEDSFYNRQNSFPVHLANHLGRFHVHTALPGATNPTIARSLQEWFLEKYDPETMDVFVLIAWTDASRIELPSETPKLYNIHNLSADWLSKTSIEYHRITATGMQGNPLEKSYIEECQRFMVNHLDYLEIYTANLILQTQYFLKMHKIKYLMCSSNTLFMTRSQINWYKHLIDKNHFIDFDNFSQSFYPKYVNLGYENKLAKYFHHGEEPHRLYAEYLHQYIKEHGLDKDYE